MASKNRRTIEVIQLTAGEANAPIINELLRSASCILEASIKVARLTKEYERWMVTLKLRARGPVLPGINPDDPNDPGQRAVNEAERKLAWDIVLRDAREKDKEFRDLEAELEDAERMLQFEKDWQINCRIVLPQIQ